MRQSYDRRAVLETPGRGLRAALAVLANMNSDSATSPMPVCSTHFPRARSVAGAAVQRFGCEWLILIACALLALAHLPALAGSELARDPRDHIVERAWLEDSTNSLGPDQVRSMMWTPYSGPLRRGYTSSTTWLRLKIAATDLSSQRNPERGAQLVLRMMPGHLDEIALFDPRHPGEPPQLAGDTYDWRQGRYRSFNQNLVIGAPNEPVDILLRIRTTGNHGLHVEALRWDDIEEIDGAQQLIFGAVVMFLFSILAWAVMAWWDSRERLLSVFIVQQVVSIIFTLSLLGFFRVYLSDLLSAQTIDRIHSAVFPLTATTVLWFHLHFLKEFDPPAVGIRLLKWFTWMTPITLALMLAGYVRWALQITMVIVLLTPPLLLLLAWFTVRPAPGAPSRLTRWQLISIYTAMMLILWNATLPAFGWQPTQVLTMYGAVAYGVVSALILFLALRRRARHLEASHRDNKTRLALTEQQVAREQASRREQEQFMTMLTHELTNALATAQLAIGSLSSESPMRGRGYRAIESMRDIVRRCALSGEIEAARPVIELATVDLTAVLGELCSQPSAANSVVLTTAPGLPICSTDRQLLNIVLGNLLDNALKYRSADSPVTVSAVSLPREGRSGVQVCVSNTLGELDPPDPEQLFKKYWRGAGAQRYPGSGLGLYLSSIIAQRLGGELNYRPENSTVSFVLWLPA